MKRIAALLLMAWFTIPNALAFDSFMISDVRIDGLSRIAPGTVFTYLPVEKGDLLTTERASDAIRALYRTGFFKDVSLSRQGDILVISVEERPQVSKVVIRGNKDIKEDDLRKGLKAIGLDEGEAFDPLKLDEIRAELTRQYYNRGKYNVSIKTTVIPLDRNRVEAAINIAEGKPAKIKHLNVVGNDVFTQKEIKDNFDSSVSNWTSWYSKDDQYSREKLSGDLEKLTSHYMDRGFVDFNVESTQVSISPDKRKMYVVANIEEGEIYTVSKINLTGTLVLDEADLRRLLRISEGDLFSRKDIEDSADAISGMLANIGYAFADVQPIPDIDRESRKVALNFFVVPGKRVYVRRIVFKGNIHTEDEVARREMRQLEGAWYSQAAIDRSKIRLQRLGHFRAVSVDTNKVAGSDDQIDVMVNLEEQPAGSFNIGFGYSRVSHLMASVAVQQNNLFGTGDRIALSASKSYYSTRYDLQYFEPYLTDSGIGLGYNVRHSKMDLGDANMASYLSNLDSFDIYLGLPIGENSTVNAQLGISKNHIGIYPGRTPQSIIDFINNIGRRTMHIWDARLSWAHDTRNKYWNPTRGSLQTVSLDVALPGSTVEFWRVNYKYGQYLPLSRSLTFYGSLALGYGDGYGISDELPFFENFYAGGASDVRGFRDYTLGPFEIVNPELCPIERRECRQPIGGAFKTVASAEIIFPTPFMKESSETTRISAFVDVGNVFTNYDAFDANELRASAGLAFQWRAPIGPIIINLSRPIRKKPYDQTETVQFTFGNQF